MSDIASHLVRLGLGGAVAFSALASAQIVPPVAKSVQPAKPGSNLHTTVPVSSPTQGTPTPMPSTSPAPTTGIPVILPGRGTAVPAGSQGLGTAVPVNPQGLGTAVPVGSSQPPLARPPEGPGTAVPVGSGPPVVVPIDSAGGIVVQTPSDGRQGGPMLVTPVGPANTNPATSGHYQLIARDFRVLHQTFDDTLERDGAGDEIQIRSTALNVAPDGRFLGDTAMRSGSFGAPDRTDFGAGTAEPGFSAEQRIGGLKTGDVYPPRPREIQHNGDMPIVIWEGVLSMGGNGVIVVPTIWELDPTPGSTNRDWGRALVDLARNNQRQIADTLSTLVTAGGSSVADSLFAPVELSISGTERPIATTSQQPPLVTIADILIPPIGPRLGFAIPKMVMKVPAIPLSYARAEQLAGRAPSRIGVNFADGSQNGFYEALPQGGFAIRYTDPPGMDGDYLLILQLVRMPD